MRRTAEQCIYGEFLALEAARAGGGKPYRLGMDSEGFPVLPGRYGWVEYYGPELGGEHRLRVWTGSRRIATRLLAIRGVHGQQVGDEEARCWFLAGEPAVLRAVCGVIRVRVRRVIGAVEAAEMARRFGR